MSDEHDSWIQNALGIDVGAALQKVEDAGSAVDPNAGQPNQSVDPSAGQPNQSVDPSADQPNQSVDPSAGQPNQSVDPSAGQPNQSVDPSAGLQSGSRTAADGTATLPEITIEGDANFARAYDLGFADGLAGAPTHRGEMEAIAPGPTELLANYEEGFRDGQKKQSDDDDGLPPGNTSGVEDNSTSSRVLRAIEIAATEKLGGATGAKLRELATPANLAALMAFVGLYIAAQATPAGWVADGIAIVTLVASAAMIGKELSGVIDEVRAFVSLCESPSGDLDVAAQHLANAATTIGIDVLLAIILHKAGSAAKPYIKPPTGMVEMVTDSGLIVQVPAEAVQAATLGRPVIPPAPLHMEGDPEGDDDPGQSNRDPSGENSSHSSSADSLRSQNSEALVKGGDGDYNILVDDANDALSALDRAEADYNSADKTDPSVIAKHQALEDARATAENNLNELNREFKLRAGVQPGSSVYDGGRILYNNGAGLKSISAWESPGDALGRIQKMEKLPDTPKLGKRTDLGDWWNGASEHYLVENRNGSLMNYDLIRSKINGKNLWSWIKTTHTAR